MRKKVEEKILSDYEKYYRLAFSYVRNENDAMDIVQESAYKAMKEYRSLKKEEYLSTWLYRIVVNSALDFIRKNKRETPSVIKNEDYYMDHYEDFDVMDSLSKLDSSERAIIILRFFEEEKLETIAEILDENLSTTKSRLYRALKKLKIDLESEQMKNGIVSESNLKNNSKVVGPLDSLENLKTGKVW